MNNKIYLIIIAIFSLGINQFFANKGVFPIDNFLIFDSAYNITKGFHPFKDYWLITGPFLDYTQSLFFIIFGVQWFSYVLHASIINMIFALFSFYFFIKIGLKNYYAFIYSIGVAILAYPSIGTPFIDHHAVIFCLMAFYSFSLGVLFKKNIFWFITPFFLIFSFFSKQIPSAYLLVFFIITILIYFLSKNTNKKNFIYLLFGSFLSLSLIMIIFFINEIPYRSFFIQYIFYPASLGEDRTSNLNIDFKNLILQFKFIYLALIPLFFCSFFILKEYKKKSLNKNEFIILFLFFCSIFVIIYCQLLTRNQILIFFVIPIISALSHAYSLKFFNKKYLIFFILGIFIFSTVKYHIRFNENKKFIELSNVNFDLSENADQIDQKLKGLKWITPHYPNQPLVEINLLKEVKNILLKKKGRKIIVTDYQFFPSMLNNEFASPNKWYDDLSIPNKENKYYNEYKDFFLNKILINEIEYIFFIGDNKSKIDFFKELRQNNDCIISKKINELLIEFNINKCKKIL